MHNPFDKRESLQLTEGLVDTNENSVAVLHSEAEDYIGRLMWKSRDGKLTRLQNMADSHLRNTALMLMGFGFSKYNAPDSIKIIWLTALRVEWQRRMTIREFSKAHTGTGDD